jgi:hypothetical protein
MQRQETRLWKRESFFVTPKPQKSSRAWLDFVGRTVDVSADGPNVLCCFLVRHVWGTKAKPLAAAMPGGFAV